MTIEDADLDRLALAEVTCRLAHVGVEVAALAEHRAFPAMPDGRRATRLAELEMERVSLQCRHDELAVRVPNPEQVRAPDGTLPADRRRANLITYRTRRREKLGELEAKVRYIDTVLADKAAPREVRHGARGARASAVHDIDVLHAEPSDEDLRPEDMCADGVHLASSHGYVWTSAQPAWPCAAWPGR